MTVTGINQEDLQATMDDSPLVLAEPAVEQAASGRGSLRYERLWRHVGHGLVLFVIYASLTPKHFDGPIEFQGMDKLGHALAYLTLTAWFGWLNTDRPAQLRAAGAFLLLGLTLETIQRYTGYRVWDLWDIAANTAGVVIGLSMVRSALPNGIAFADRCLRGVLGRAR
jgi:VanZ family protein